MCAIHSYFILKSRDHKLDIAIFFGAPGVLPDL